MPQCATKSSTYGSFSGIIFGPTLWLLLLAGLVHDWAASAVIFACDIALFLIVTRMCLGCPERYWSGVFVVVSGLVVMTLTVINLRWNDWMIVYRQSSQYNPTNDVSLKTINLIVIAAYVAIGLPLWYVGHKRRRQARAE